MTAAHKPGPWRPVDRPRVGMEEHKWEVEPVCFLFGTLPADVQKATAHLISAAPDMRQELQNARNVLALALPLFPKTSSDDHDSREEVESLIAGIDAALAKADGKA